MIVGFVGGLFFVGLAELISALRNKSSRDLWIGIACFIIGGFLYYSVAAPMQQSNEEDAQDARIQKILDEQYNNNNNFSQ